MPTSRFNATIQAELKLLGTALLNKDLWPGTEGLTRTDFFLSSHQTIFGTMAAMYEDGRAVNETTLTAALTQSGQLDAIGGYAYIGKLIDLADERALPENFSSYVEIVCTDSRMRRFERLQKQLSEAVDTEARLSLIQQMQEALTVSGEPNNWRKGCKSFGQLSSTMPRFLLSGLIPENALTAVPAPSYHCKTWWALQMGHAVSEGLPLFCFDAPEKVPVIYHVPEMNEALIRERMAMLGIEDSENFLVRPMELGIWSLKDPRMIESSKGRLVFLDTQGFFNEADDQNSYKQALDFAENVFNLLNQGARAVVMLTHPPKYSTQRLQKEPPWTLENSVIGSAAYGGILRSCLRVRNLNLDLNDKHPWIYVQGLKNPGLQPFQLEDIPLRMKVAPGESPYLHALLAGIEDHDADPRQQKAYAMFERGASNRLIIKELKSRNTTVKSWREQWELERKERQQKEPNDTLQ